MENLGAFWKKLIIWLTGYLNIIAFIVGGGYLYLKTDDEEIKCSAKLALFTVAAFTGLDIIYAILYNLFNIFGAGYETLANLAIVQRIFALAEIIVFLTLFILDILGKINRLKSRCREPERKSEYSEQE